jgi:hypothetical protein
MTIVTRHNVDQFTLLERQIVQEARRPNIVGPDALLDGDEDVNRGLARRVIGALRKVCHHVVDGGGLSAPFFHLPGTGADHNQPTIAVTRQGAPDRHDQPHDHHQGCCGLLRTLRPVLEEELGHPEQQRDVGIRARATELDQLEERALRRPGGRVAGEEIRQGQA